MNYFILDFLLKILYLIFRIQQRVNLFEHFLDINVALRVYNIEIKLLLVVHRIILYGLENLSFMI